MKRHMLMVLALVGAPGCASIIEGTSQQIFVNTNPPGAACNFIREDRRIARVSLTPQAVTIKKNKHDIVIECELAGFHKSTYHNKSDVAGATFGNIVLSGGIGWAVDSAAGADNKYTSPVNLTLVPLNQAAPAPEYSNPPAGNKDTSATSP